VASQRGLADRGEDVDSQCTMKSQTLETLVIVEYSDLFC
jgi:hypothetical protein